MNKKELIDALIESLSVEIPIIDRISSVIVIMPDVEMALLLQGAFFHLRQIKCTVRKCIVRIPLDESNMTFRAHRI